MSFAMKNIPLRDINLSCLIEQPVFSEVITSYLEMQKEEKENGSTYFSNTDFLFHLKNTTPVKDLKVSDSIKAALIEAAKKDDYSVNPIMELYGDTVFRSEEFKYFLEYALLRQLETEDIFNLKAFETFEAEVKLDFESVKFNSDFTEVSTIWRFKVGLSVDKKFHFQFIE